MKLAGLAIGILLAAGPSWAADLKATLKKAEAGEAASQYQLAERYAEADGVIRIIRQLSSGPAKPPIKAMRRLNIEWHLFYFLASPGRHANPRPYSSSVNRLKV